MIFIHNKILNFYYKPFSKALLFHYSDIVVFENCWKNSIENRIIMIVFNRNWPKAARTEPAK